VEQIRRDPTVVAGDADSGSAGAGDLVGAETELSNSVAGFFNGGSIRLRLHYDKHGGGG
jgi:hypothetical protein